MPSTGQPGRLKKQYIIYCSDFRLKDLIDVNLSERSSYICSLTEPFNTEMEIKEDQIKNLFVYFGVIKRDPDWSQIHTSGHEDWGQIKYVVENTNNKSLISIETVKDEYYEKLHLNMISTNQHNSTSL